MATIHPTRHRRRSEKHSRINLLSAAVLMVSLVAVALVLIGVANRDSSPLWVIPPMLLAFWCIVTLRE